jgi:hypothetical protein
MLILRLESHFPQNQVKWTLMGYGLSYESNVTFFQMDKSFGNDLQTGLDTLKMILEKR